MTSHRFSARSLLSFFVLFVLISLACNAPVGRNEPEAASKEPVQPAEAAETQPAQVEQAAAPEQVEPAAEESAAEESAAEEAGAEAAGAEAAGAEEPAAEQPAAELGFSFENPYPVGTKIETPYWDVQVLEYMRGEPAFQRILQDKPDADPPPAGMEYVVLHMVIKNKFLDEYSHSVGLGEVFIAGNGRLKRTDSLTDVPSPEIVYTDTYAAEELDAWHDALVGIDEGNLVFIWNPSDGTQEPARFLALEEGAAPSPPPDLASIMPNELGLDPADPAPFGQTVVTENWEVTVLDVLHGEPAADLFRQLHEGNEVDEGMVPTVVKLRVRYINEDPEAQFYHVSLGEFAAAQDAERVYEGSRYYIWDPYDPPWMQISFLPGGQHEGWMILQSPTGESDIMLRFKPGDLDAMRYLSLTP